MLALGDNEGSGPACVSRGERRAVLDDRILRAPALVGAGIILPVHGKDVGGEVEHERIRTFGHKIDGEIVNGARFAKRFEQRLEVGTLFQPVEGPNHIFG